MMGWTHFNKSVTAVPETAWDVAYDSEFEKSVFNDKNHTLKLKLRIHFRQINPNQLTAPMARVIAQTQGMTVPADGRNVGVYPDADDAAKFIKEWNTAEWLNFINGVKAQASLWNGKFWLIPPDDFSYFDIETANWTNKSGKTITRMNVKCEFELEVVPYAPYAHRAIDVVNLISPNFRSHDRLYSTDDTTNSNYTRQGTGGTVSTTQPTIAHEIGHALGLPHIGVTRGRSQCQLAMVWGKGMPQNAIPALWRGGSNADVCYGTFSATGDINNIMGFGNNFDTENASPWLDRMFLHMNVGQQEYIRILSSMSKWQISLTPALPMTMVFPGS
jgi:hypothetical protein